MVFDLSVIGIGTTNGTTMSFLERLSHRYSRPGHTLQKRKGKFYVHVTVPQLIRFKFNGNRYLRRSTGFSDQKRANSVAPDIAEALYDEFRDAILSLDPLLEAARSKLTKLNVNLDDWYGPRRKLLIRVPLRSIEAGKHLLQAGSGVETEFGDQMVDIEVDDHDSLMEALSQLGFHNIPETEVSNVASQELSFTTLTDISEKHQDAVRSDLGRSLMNQSNKSRMRSLTSATKMTFNDYLKTYITTRQKLGDASKQLTTRKSDCEQFVAIVGNHFLDEYENYHGAQFAKHLSDKGVSNSTIKRKISYVRGLFKCAHEQNADKKTDDPKRIEVNIPFSGLDLSKYGWKKRSYKPLTHEMLYTLFDLEMDQREFAVLSLLVTTGMRLDEICLLEWSQIHKQDGNLFVNLLDANVKNQGSSRFVALHRLTYPLVQNLGRGRLFDYSIDKDGKAENAASRVLMPLIRQITNDDRMVVHSLRGNFKDLMRDADVSKENHDFMTGHSVGDAASQYGMGPSHIKRVYFTNMVEHPWITQSRNFDHYMKALL